MSEREAFDVIIVGSGMAGASLAHFLAQRGCRDVLLLEREAHPGYHATGRSAAVLVEWDPVPAVQALKMLGGRFLRKPPSGFAENPLLDPAGIVVTFEEPLWGAVRATVPSLLSGGTQIQVLSAAAIVERVPVLDPAWFAGGVLLPEDGHIDVHELLSSYLRHASRAGVERRYGVEVVGVAVERGRCRGVMTTAGTLSARWVVDAAGAWAGEVARMAGAMPLSLVPHRRTVVVFDAPDGIDVRRWPLVSNETQHLYFKPESGGLMASPMDEDPLSPCDAQPDELVVAETMARVEKLAPRLAPRSLRRTWAGLRTFAPDRVPVVGEDLGVAGFFWLAGQGGCGIETSPAVGQIAADLIIDGRTDLFDRALLSPGRFG